MPEAVSRRTGGYVTDDEQRTAMSNHEPRVMLQSSPIHAARRGDRAALAGMLAPFRDYLTLMARRSIGPDLATKAGASDIVQETFLAAQRGIEGFRGSTPEEWRAWLEAILAHQLANFRRRYLDTRKRDGEPRCQGGGAGLTDWLRGSITPASRQLQRRERDAALEAALRRLPEHYRQVIRWHHDDGLTFEAIGSRLGISADGARKQWGRALVSLKRDLGPDHDPR
jgi:RNA polymerase sigma-70 factor (ECF subfamily)